MTRDDDEGVTAHIGPVRSMPNLRTVPGSDLDDDEAAMKGALFFPNKSEAPNVVVAGRCTQCSCRYYRRDVSSDAVRVLQCVSCSTLYLDE